MDFSILIAWPPSQQPGWFFFCGQDSGDGGYSAGGIFGVQPLRFPARAVFLWKVFAGSWILGPLSWILTLQTGRRCNSALAAFSWIFFCKNGRIAGPSDNVSELSAAVSPGMGERLFSWTWRRKFRIVRFDKRPTTDLCGPPFLRGKGGFFLEFSQDFGDIETWCKSDIKPKIQVVLPLRFQGWLFQIRPAQAVQEKIELDILGVVDDKHGCTSLICRKYKSIISHSLEAGCGLFSFAFWFNRGFRRRPMNISRNANCWKLLLERPPTRTLNACEFRTAEEALLFLRDNPGLTVRMVEAPALEEAWILGEGKES
jgi:hypothetical protein